MALCSLNGIGGGLMLLKKENVTHYSASPSHSWCDIQVWRSFPWSWADS